MHTWKKPGDPITDRNSLFEAAAMDKTVKKRLKNAWIFERRYEWRCTLQTAAWAFSMYANEYVILPKISCQSAMKVFIHQKTNNVMYIHPFRHKHGKRNLCLAITATVQ